MSLKDFDSRELSEFNSRLGSRGFVAVIWQVPRQARICLKMDADKAPESERSKGNSFYLLEAVKTLKSHVNDSFAFPDASAMDSTSSAFHTHRMQSIKSTPYLCSAVERYTNVR